MTVSAESNADSERASPVLAKQRIEPVNRPTGNFGLEEIPTLEFEFPAMLRFLDGGCERLPVTIRSVTTGFFRLTCARQVAANRPICLTLKHKTMPGVTAFCVAVGPDKFRVGVEIWAEGSCRRKEVRIPVKISAKIAAAPAQRPSQTVDVEIVDISASGCGFIGPIEYVPGTPLMIDIGYGMMFAEVRHCCPAHGRFRVGCELEQYVDLTSQPQDLASEARPHGLWDRAERSLTHVATHFFHRTKQTGFEPL